MKISLVFVVLAALCLSMTSAQPVVSSLGQGLSLLVKEESESPVEELQYFEEDSQEVLGSRMKRATCDLLSISTKFGSLNHAACAAHCLVMGKGFRGGRCRDGVCHCRR